MKPATKTTHPGRCWMMARQTSRPLNLMRPRWFPRWIPSPRTLVQPTLPRGRMRATPPTKTKRLFLTTNHRRWGRGTRRQHNPARFHSPLASCTCGNNGPPRRTGGPGNPGIPGRDGCSCRNDTGTPQHNHHPHCTVPPVASDTPAPAARPAPRTGTEQQGHGRARSWPQAATAPAGLTTMVEAPRGPR